ncbi:sulfite exporter TauE/SafE family protein [Lewinella sp. IMCC34191]|uniref:sulfite exporter TauE/SafE family protein n=1 Tax=Lewinella sp. IMCC34191 TaxID=2259172 RepID=UPI0018E5462D|nr:sulfite exporter TauE/SafE family protein [Lewinella sp. IMCC34191]
MDLYWLIPAFFAIALLYASAGFGGGSSYLALLALSGLPTGAMRPIALVCNLVVTGGSTVSFARAGVTPWRRALPLVGASMPAAFLGGRIQLARQEYLLLLGGLLLVAGILMIVGKGAKRTTEEKAGRRSAGIIAVTIGIGVGFVSGVVGIGGGIFLSPILFLSRWADARAIAATTSLFIALNSLAGLAGQLSVGLEWHLGLTAMLALPVAAGGWLGTRLTLRRFTPATIRNVAAVLILLVGARLVWSNWLMQL